ncbi:DNA double-strand break repair ATPase Rad50 [Thermoplasma sp. Kam2015]|uniref:DNA double-strand break repair ATPase Rad50 n=1 Tax=Thermoplasma sp. Kam2015 TaxID=2094122 RepID=UPI00137A6FB8|nr:DNA double-strand break repair ATPase Rad50 [Thermoplasma sp. Kam2015]
MIIDRIRLTNFLSHEDSEIYFDTGVNVIVGHNGAGKSSIVDAIRFALFGDRRTKKIEDMIRKGAKNLEVEMEFRHAGHTYIIRRSITRRSKNPESNAIVLVDGYPIAQSVKDANDYIEKNIMIRGKDVFLNSVFSKQGEMDELISGDPAKRKQLLDEILEIDVLEETYDLLKEVINQMGSSITNLDYLISENQSDEANVERYSEEISTMEKRKAEELAIIEDLQKDRDAANDEYAKLNKELIELDTKIKAMKSDLQSAEEYEKKLAEIERMLDEISVYTGNYENIVSSAVFQNRDRIRSYWTDKAQIIENKKAMKRIDDQIEKYEENFSRYRELEPYHLEYEKRQARQEEIKKEIEKLSDTHSRYESIRIDLEKKKKNLEQNRKRLNDLRTEISSRIGLSFVSAMELDSIYQEMRREIDDASNKKSSLMTGLSLSKQKIEEISRNMELLKGQKVCPVCGTDLGEKKTEDLYDHYAEDLRKEKDQIEGIEEQIKKLGDRIDGLRRLEEYLGGGKIREYSTLEKQIDDLNSQIADDVKAMEDLGEGNKKYLQLDEEYRSIDVSELRDRDNEWRSAKAVVENIGDIESLRKEKDDMFERIKEIEQRMGSVEREFPDINSYTPSYLSKLEEDVKNLETEVRKAEDLKKQKNELEIKIRDLRSRASGMDEAEKKREDLSLRVKQAEEKVRGFDDRIARSNRTIYSLESSIETMKRTVTETKEKISSRNRQIDQMKRIAKAIEDVKKIREAFGKNGVPAMIRQNVSDYLTSRTRDYLSSFELDFDDISIDQDFNVTVYRGGVPEGIDSLSGGEKTAVAFAIRVAVAQFLNTDLSLLILDEPTAFLDEERRNSLSNIIEYTLKDASVIPQVIIISHHRELLSTANVAIEVKKVNGRSVVINAD